MTESCGFERPRWLRDLLRFLPLKSQFVLSGNVRDLQLSQVNGIVAHQPLTATLAQELRVADVRGKVRAEIENHFKTVLNRPEILNRIGDNILVFDFIRPLIAVEIFESMVARVLSDVEFNQQVDIALDEPSRTQLEVLCLADLSNGGCGIRNKVETHLVNPLARAFFECAPEPGSARKIKNLSVGSDGVTTFQLAQIAEGAKP